LTYLKDFSREDWYTGHAWSLSIEEHFYIIYPLIFLLGTKISKIVTIIFIFIPLIVKSYILYLPTLPFKFLADDLNLFYRIDSIAFGCLLAYYKDCVILFLKNFNFKIIFLFCILFFILLLFFNMNKIHGHSHLLSKIYYFFGTLHGTFANILICIILLLSVYDDKSLWYKLLNSKVLNYIGVLSYSIYLWQQLFTSTLNSWVTSFPQNLLFIFIASLFSYYLIEKPILKYKSKFIK